MADTIQVLLVAERDTDLANLEQIFTARTSLVVLAAVQGLAEAVTKLDILSPDVILLHLAETDTDALEWVERVSALHPSTSIVVIAASNDAADVRKCMRAGAKDYLAQPLDADTLCQSIQTLIRHEQSRLQRNTVAMLSERTTRQSRLIAFISAKGGVGKTTMAVNTAAALAQQGKRVALVDLDLQFGDASLLMNVSPERSLIDLVRESQDIDPEVVERYLTLHESGVMLLPTGAKPEEAEYVTAAHIRVILQSLKKRFDYVIIDTAPQANDLFFTILEMADEQFMVSTLNLAVLKNNRLLLDLLRELDYDVQKIKHVLNRVNAKNGLKVKDVSRALNADVHCELDNDFRFVETAANEGVLFVLKDPKHRLSKQIYALTARLEEAVGGRISRRNPLQKLLGR